MSALVQFILTCSNSNDGWHAQLVEYSDAMLEEIASAPELAGHPAANVAAAILASRRMEAEGFRALVKAWRERRAASNLAEDSEDEPGTPGPG